MIVAQPFDPSLMGAIEKAIRVVGPRAQPGQRRQGGADPDSVAHRRAPQGAVTPRAQAGRGRPQRRAPGAPRRQRPPEEAPQGAQDLRRRRAEGPRAGPEDHRRSRQADRRAAEEEGPGPARPLSQRSCRRGQACCAPECRRSSTPPSRVRSAGTPGRGREARRSLEQLFPDPSDYPLVRRPICHTAQNVPAISTQLERVDRKSDGRTRERRLSGSTRASAGLAQAFSAQHASPADSGRRHRSDGNASGAMTAPLPKASVYTTIRGRPGVLYAISHSESRARTSALSAPIIDPPV